MFSRRLRANQGPKKGAGAFVGEDYTYAVAHDCWWALCCPCTLCIALDRTDVFQATLNVAEYTMAVILLMLVIL